jgi:hypothetical protein
MISRTWTHEDYDGTIEAYKGFNRDFRPSEVNRVAIAMWDGELEIWAIDDDKQAESEWVRYITERSERDGGTWTIVGIFNRK